ncbi:MAG: hypothetical protein ACE5HI_12765, partial [bacterium]
SQGCDNDPEVIPKSLFSINTKNFDDQKLGIALKHRLINLWYQYSESKIEFTSVIQNTIGARISQPRQYFITLLGFATRSERVEDEDRIEDVYFIRKINLLDEEINWLKEKFPKDETTEFSELVSTLEEVWEFLPDKSGYPKSINSLYDCEKFLKKLNNESLSEEIDYDIRVSISSYFEYNDNEVSALEKSQEGRRILGLLERWQSIET